MSLYPHGRPSDLYRGWHQTHTDALTGWRRAHSLASLRACLGVLTFAAEAEARRRWFAALQEFVDSE